MTFHLLTRSGRISYDDLRLRDPRFGAAVDTHFPPRRQATADTLVAPPPLLRPLRLAQVTLPNRAVVAPSAVGGAPGGVLAPAYRAALTDARRSGVGLVLAGPLAVSADGRITPDCPGMYAPAHVERWQELLRAIDVGADRGSAGARVRLGAVLNHAGRRGATRPRGAGLDRPLRADDWPLLAPSPLPYLPHSQVPRAMGPAEMRRVGADFARAARLAAAAGFDLLLLHMAHGYLLASFLSPLTNQREDEYGGTLERRLRFPLEVLAAVRAAWPADKPLGVALNVDDCAPGGLTVEDAVVVARALAARGCALIQVLVGQTVRASEPAYGRGFLTAYSDRLRNEAGVATLLGGYLTTANELNTALAAGRADLCILEAAQAPGLARYSSSSSAAPSLSAAPILPTSSSSSARKLSLKKPTSLP